MAASTSGAAKPFIRPYDPNRDLDALIDVFRETAHAAVQAEPCLTYGEYLWIRPYLHLYPEACFVLDNGAGVAVGYIVGTPSTTDFALRWPLEFLPTVDPATVPVPPRSPLAGWDTDRPTKLLQFLYFDQLELLHGLWPQLWDKFPAHLHIDIKAPWTGRGYGRKLIRVFLDHLKKEKAEGVHLGMVATNTRAGRFYEQLNFQRYDKVLDDGRSGEKGMTDGVIMWVKDI